MPISLRSFSFYKIAICIVLGLCLLLAACGSTGHQVAHTSTRISYSTPSTSTKTLPVQKTSATSSFPVPVRLIVPSANINAAIEDVGITSTGELATPASDPWDDAGWYASGTRPGDIGSAVIDGHLDRPGGSPAVFWNLKLLHPGDEILVLASKGSVFHFKVDSVSVYTPQTAPLQTIFGRTGGHYLNLITCAGTWIPSQHQTTQRLIVYATRVS